MTYTSPTWVDVGPGEPIPPGAPALDAANLQPLTDTVAALPGTYAATIPMVGTGIDPTGSADSTTAIQALITAAPNGAQIIAPLGVFQFSNLTFDHGKSLRGAGFQSLRDATTTFGDSAYATGTNFGGTVFRSTATSGDAITFLTTGVNNEGGTLADFILIGPGSGTSVGIHIGTSTRSVLAPMCRNVKVCNFATGWLLENVNEGVLQVFARGCTTGVSVSSASNANVWHLLNVQRCTTGLTISSDTTQNVFLGPIGQNNTTGCVNSGSLNTFLSVYSENETTPGWPALLWTAATMLNSWTGQFSYRVTEDGRHVELGGLGTRGASGSQVPFNLPAGVRPHSQQTFAAANNSTGATCWVSISASTGDVTINVSASQQAALDTIVFPLDL